MIELEIQGQTVRAEPGEGLLDVIRRAGFEVPSLCHHPGLTPYGACRLCLVEVERGGRRKLTTSCNYAVQPGLRVWLDTERVLRHRRMVLELLLARASAAPQIRALAAAHGVTATRFPAQDQRCILCGLCERVCRERVGADALTFAGRGAQRALGSPFADPAACVGCGACSAVCPTDCLTMEPEALARMRLRPAAERVCRYVLAGLMDDGPCGNDYRCETCEVHGRLTRRAGDHPAFLAPAHRTGGHR